MLLGTRSPVSIASIVLARLERLEVLRLNVGEQPGLTIDTSWVPRSRLMELKLVGFAFTPQNIDDAAARVDRRSDSDH